MRMCVWHGVLCCSADRAPHAGAQMGQQPGILGGGQARRQTAVRGAARRGRSSLAPAIGCWTSS